MPDFVEERNFDERWERSFIDDDVACVIFFAPRERSQCAVLPYVSDFDVQRD
jgi:hypothetical protein